MLKINPGTQVPDEAMQSKWRQGQLPHLCCVAIGDGRLVLMEEMASVIDGQIQQHISPLCESWLQSFVEFSGEFVEVTSLVPQLQIGEDLYATCGEGAMGNEGFVATMKGEKLFWAAFFATSNPFYKLVFRQDMLVATSTHDLEWNFPILSPWEVTVEAALDR